MKSRLPPRSRSSSPPPPADLVKKVRGRAAKTAASCSVSSGVSSDVARAVKKEGLAARRSALVASVPFRFLHRSASTYMLAASPPLKAVATRKRQSRRSDAISTVGAREGSARTAASRRERMYASALSCSSEPHHSDGASGVRRTSASASVKAGSATGLAGAATGAGATAGGEGAGADAAAGGGGWGGCGGGCGAFAGAAAAGAAAIFSALCLALAARSRSTSS
mmetsp:Transcript_16320/g.53197  ORF Transcript_16320/g.53197 Transcript_16320/m.53197 type:complete len:224 (-) Transcript_16320:47-718(-)